MAFSCQTISNKCFTFCYLLQVESRSNQNRFLTPSIPARRTPQWMQTNECNKMPNNSLIRAQSDKHLEYISLTSSSCELLLRSCCHENDHNGTLYWKKKRSLIWHHWRLGTICSPQLHFCCATIFFSSYVSSQGSKKEVIWKVYNFFIRYDVCLNFPNQISDGSP